MFWLRAKYFGTEADIMNKRANHACGTIGRDRIPTIVRRPRRLFATGRRGGTIIEMAISISLLMSLTFGMVEFSYAFYCKNMLIGAAREGVRAGIASGTARSDVTTAVANALATTNWTAQGYYTVKVSAPTSTPTTATDIGSTLGTMAAGTQLQVSVYATWGNLGSGFNPLHLISSSKNMIGSCVMRKEP